jgi:hypothetical protein
MAETYVACLEAEGKLEKWSSYSANIVAWRIKKSMILIALSWSCKEFDWLAVALALAGILIACFYIFDIAKQCCGHGQASL